MPERRTPLARRTTSSDLPGSGSDLFRTAAGGMGSKRSLRARLGGANRSGWQRARPASRRVSRRAPGGFNRSSGYGAGATSPGRYTPRRSSENDRAWSCRQRRRACGFARRGPGIPRLPTLRWAGRATAPCGQRRRGRRWQFERHALSLPSVPAGLPDPLLPGPGRTFNGPHNHRGARLPALRDRR